MNGWIRNNAWHIATTAILVAVLAGQWQERQSGTIAEVRRLETRVSTIEAWVGQERPRLDPIYLAREVAIAQNAEILRRLDSIETEQRQIRQLLQRQ